MKVLYLTPGCFDKGGISRYNRYQIEALRSILGQENVHVASVLGPDGESFEAPFEVGYAAGGLSLRRKAGYVAHCARRAAWPGVDLVWAAHVRLSGLAGALAAPRRARTVLMIYGLEVWSGMSPAAGWGLRNADLVVSDCHFTARYVEDEGLRTRSTTEVIWDCVDTNRFRPAAASDDVVARYRIPDPSTGINLLSFGRMSRDAAHKGYERLLEVFKLVAPRIPALRLVYAGRGDLVAELRTRAEQAGLADRVFFLGSIAEKDLPDVYRSGHIFSLVSDRGVGRGEGVPLTPLEAASCGAPILVGNQDGSQEAVVDGENGFVIDPFDLEVHADRVMRLASDPGLRERQAREARARIEREFSFARFEEKHRNLLRHRSMARS